MKRLHWLLGLFLLLVLVGIFAQQLAPHDPTQINISDKLQGMSQTYPLGTDHLGRCLLSRVIFGVRTSVFYSLVITTISILIGIVVGVTAGYSTQWLDNLLMRIVDMVLSFPTEVITFAIVGMLGIGGMNLIIASVIVRWAWYARMIRSSVVKYRHMDYVTFARLSGRSRGYVIRQHIIPDVFSEIIIYATLDIGLTLLTISSFSFLGLGVQAPTAEWGMMLSEAKHHLATHPEQMLPSGLAIVLTVILVNSIGDAINQARQERRQHVEYSTLDGE